MLEKPCTKEKMILPSCLLVSESRLKKALKSQTDTVHTINFIIAITPVVGIMKDQVHW